jgi:hypothetical protein
MDNKPLDPLENLSDIYDPGYYKGLKEAAVRSTTIAIIINNTDGQLLLQW